MTPTLTENKFVFFLCIFTGVCSVILAVTGMFLASGHLKKNLKVNVLQN